MGNVTINYKIVCNFDSNKLEQKMKEIQPLMKQKMLSKIHMQSDLKTDEFSREEDHEALRIYIQVMVASARQDIFFCGIVSGKFSVVQ